MTNHPVKDLIKAADRSITAGDFETLMAFYADDATLVVRPGLNAHGKDQILRAFHRIAEHFKHGLEVTQGEMQVLEGGDTALVIMETLLHSPDADGSVTETRRRATYVFRKYVDGQWLCVVDNSYGTDLLERD